MTSELTVIRPEWPAPPTVSAFTTTRLGGVSSAPWDSMNLGMHVHDDPASVAENRNRLASVAGLPIERFGWLQQVHGTAVALLPGHPVQEADACVTFERGEVCSILTADCLPVLLCDDQGSRVGAVHAGWRSLCGGVLEQAVARLGEPERLIAWLGPAIGPAVFEVGPEVREAFVAIDAEASLAFNPTGARSGHFLADIYRLARQRLARSGVTRVYGGDFCTVADDQHFFSYRRDGITGRMASIIWLS